MGKTKSIYVYGLTGMFAFLICWMICGVYSAEASSYGDEFEIPIQAVEKYDMAYELLEYINQERQILGMRSLTMDRELMEAALIRAAEVNVLNSHWRPNGTRSTSEMGVEAVYENINNYAVSAKNVYTGWSASTDGHRVPITDSACRSVGIGIVNHAAVALFSYAEADEVTVSGTCGRTRSVQFRMSLCTFSLDKGTSLEYGGQDKLMLVSVIENQGIPVETDLSQFKITSNSPQTVSILADGSLYGVGASTAEIDVIWKYDPAITRSNTFTVKPLDISVQGNSTFTYEQNYVYTGGIIEPQVAVMDKYGSVLKNGVDYAISYTDNVNCGTGIIEVNGMGNYSGTRYLSFTIQGNDIPEKEQIVENAETVLETELTFLANFNYIIPTVTFTQNSYTYDGKAKTPAVTVSVKGEQLQENVDYTISYESNVNPGRAVVIVKGINRCSGEYKTTFAIEKPIQKESENLSGSTAVTVQTSGTSSVITASKVTSNSVPSTNKTVTVTYSKSEQEAVSKKSTAVKTTAAKKSKKVTVKRPSIRKIKRTKKKQLTIYWKKDKTVSGYQIQYAANKKMTKGKKTVKVSKKKTSYTIKKLKSKRIYYVRIRSYKKVGGKTYYSKWSQIKKVMVK